jgi:ribosomal protein L44E
VRAQHNQCPLCRATIDASITQLLSGTHSDLQQQQQQQQRLIYTTPNRTRLDVDGRYVTTHQPVSEISFFY